MRAWLILATVLVAGALPVFVGPRLATTATPRQLVLFSLGSLTVLAFGFVVVLGVLVDPGGLSARDLPGVVGRCVDAAGRILDHPLAHWPRIVAASLLLAVIVRLAYAGIATLRSTRREVRSVLQLAGSGAERDGVIVVPATQPFAFAAGVIRRRVVVSEAFLTALDPRARSAVLAHEEAHVRGWHAALLLFGRSLSRAFPFLLPVRKAAGLLVLALEMSADEIATRKVGDPMLVAVAMLQLAEASPQQAVPSPAATGGEISLRIERLTTDRHLRGTASRVRSAGAIGLVGGLLLTLLLALPESARTLSRPDAAPAVHAFCHLPHAVG